MTVSDAKWLKELETENARLKKLLAESLLGVITKVPDYITEAVTCERQ